MVHQYTRHSDGSSKKSFLSFVKDKEEDADKMQEECKSRAKRRRSEGVSIGRVHEEKLQMVPIIVVFMQDMKPNNWFLLLLEAFS